MMLTVVFSQVYQYRLTLNKKGGVTPPPTEVNMKDKFEHGDEVFGFDPVFNIVHQVRGSIIKIHYLKTPEPSPDDKQLYSVRFDNMGVFLMNASQLSRQVDF